MKIPAIDEMFNISVESPINKAYELTSNITELTSTYMDKIKMDLIPDIPSFDNIKNLSNSALETLATSIGIDKNTFSQIMDISEKLNLSSLIDGDVNAVKAALLEQLELKNLVKHALNPDVLEMLAESVGISEKNLENMLKTSIQIKTFSDIKNMEIYELLDPVFKKKLIEDNGLFDSIEILEDGENNGEVLLKSTVYISTLLYSKNEDDRKLAESEARKLESNFLYVFKNRNSETEYPDRKPSTIPVNVSPWLENFSKIDYRVQKIAALALGFGNEEDAVLQLRDTIELLNSYKKLDEESQQKKTGLRSHLNELDSNSESNPNAINDYKEEHGLTDQQFDNACKITYSDTMINKDQEAFERMCDEDIDPDLRALMDENDPIQIIGLNRDLVIRDSNSNEIIGYNGDIVLTNNLHTFTGVKLSEKIPFKFAKVYGNFICKDMKLKDLSNAPDFVQGNFDCSLNELTSLTGAPKQVGGNFDASYNFLETLEGLPTSVGGNINLKNNDLPSLDISYSVTLVNGGDFNVADNFLVDLSSGDITNIGTLDVSSNKLRNNENLVAGSLLRVKKSIVATNQLPGKIDIKILKDKFGSDLKYEV